MTATKYRYVIIWLSVWILLQPSLTIRHDNVGEKEEDHDAGSRVVLRRQKRDFGLFTIFGAIILCARFCKNRRRVQDDTQPPSLYCPQMEPGYFAEEGQLGVNISWPQPRCRDNKGVRSVTKVSPQQSSGNFFQEGEYVLKYIATDTSGNQRSCEKRFSVQVHRCQCPQHPQNGRVSCPNSPPIFGDTCVYTCNEGYIADASQLSKQKCLVNGMLEEDFYLCKAISCGKPTVPDNAVLNYINDCTDKYNYKSMCIFKCHSGYFHPNENSQTIHCGLGGIWTETMFSCKDASPPKILDCPDSMTAYVDKNQKEGYVNYVLPTAIDKTDGQLSVEMKTGIAPKTRVKFDRSNPNNNRYTVEYTTIDSDGFRPLKPCIFFIDIEAISCGKPTVPDNAVLNYINDCTDKYNYKSMCRFKCHSGYFHPNENSQTIQCGLGGIWTETMFSCKDASPPKILDCPDSMTAYVDKNQKEGYVDYVLPTAIDKTDGQLSVEMKKGIAPKTRVKFDRSNPTYNSYTVEYTTIDSDGFRPLKPCIFFIHIEANVPPAIWKTRLLRAPELLCPLLEPAKKLNISCSPYLSYGTTCSFSCLSGYPMVGPIEVPCEKSSSNPPRAYWDWGEGQIKTHCTVAECPPLDAPKNGAMSCTPISIGLYCQMSCHENYDIPLKDNTRTAEYLCDDASGWLFGDVYVPDCSVTRRSEKISLPTKLHYFSGNCSSKLTQDSIKENVIHLLKTTSAFNKQCKDARCTFENVNVTCGEVDHSSRKKRSVNVLVVHFDITVVIPDGEDVDELNKKVEAELYGMFDNIETEIQAGEMDITGLEIDKTSLKASDPQLICDEGMIAKFSTFSCVPCLAGHMYDTSSDDCSPCPVGTYQNKTAQTRCISCPVGFSTKDVGSKNGSYCIALCPAGRYSSDGMVPCQSCDKNTYQDQPGMSECIECPPQTNSSIQAATSIYDCKSVIDVCQDITCNNKGTCLSILREYKCVCEDGYTGIHCTEPPDPCLGHLCQNGSPCVSHSSSYTCLCSADFDGKYCQIKKVVDICQDITCNNKGTCLSILMEYKCVCEDGYTGIHCTEPPDLCLGHLCQNGSPCVSHSSSYTCLCSADFDGKYCQIKKVHGGWSSWGKFSPCSVSCGQGVQSRQRRCDSPQPSNGGHKCDGSDLEEQICNSKECPSCKALEHRPSVHVTYTKDDISGEMNATLTCLNWKRLQPPDPDVLTCSEGTGYNWSPSLDPEDLPTCVETSTGTSLNLNNSLSFSTTDNIGSELADASISIIKSLTYSSPCLKSGQCKTTINTITELKKKGQSIVYITQITQMISIDFNSRGHLQVNTAYESLKEYISVMNDLEVLADSIESATENGKFNITLNGKLYGPMSVSIITGIGCPGGMTSSTGLCENCAPGSYELNNECFLCEFGSYQELEGKQSCTCCPHGQVTKQTGAVNISMCIPVTQDTAGIKVTCYEEETVATVTVGGVIGIVIGVIVTVFIVAVFITGCVLYCHARKRRGEQCQYLLTQQHSDSLPTYKQVMEGYKDQRTKKGEYEYHTIPQDTEC